MDLSTSNPQDVPEAFFGVPTIVDNSYGGGRGSNGDNNSLDEINQVVFFAVCGVMLRVVFLFFGGGGGGLV